MADRLHHTLPRYINYGVLARRDWLWSLLPQQLFRRNARKIIEQYNAYRNTHTQTTASEVAIQVDLYEGTNPHVLRMRDYLSTRCEQDVLGAYVHGSLGTYEEIPYSDFDALVILRNEVFETPARLATVAYKLSQARAIMLDFDPLQHHGWFVLTEAQLKAYPAPYFPLALYSHAKSLLPATSLQLTVPTQSPPGEAWEHSFRVLSTSIMHRVAGMRYPSNMYELKFMLSQFMLLPALYVQAREQATFFKT